MRGGPVSALGDRNKAIEVLGGFFHQEAQDGKGFSGSGMIVGYTLTDIDVRIVLDGSVTPEPGRTMGVYVNDPAAPEPKTEFLMDSDTFDKIMSGDSQPMMLLMSGKVKAKGDVPAAMRLLPAMARVIPHYKEYRKTH
jgi:hypothetical protein